ncbi:MAG: hypothetical protein V4617_21765 [Gemmatimonadota bacterium]
MRLFVHSRAPGEYAWDTCVVEHFARVPCVGELFSTRADGPWYEVRMVVHAPYSLADYTAELFAVECDRSVAMGRVLEVGLR